MAFKYNPHTGKMDRVNDPGGEFETPIKTTVSAYGISAGETYTGAEDMLRKLTAPYVAPVFSSFSVTLNPLATAYEVGQSVAPTAFNIGRINDSDGNPPQNEAVSGPAIGADVTCTSKGSKTWMLAGDDINGDEIPSLSYTKWWYYRWFFGGHASVISDNASCQTVLNALSQSKLISGRNTTVSADANNADVNKYTYIAYEASNGDLNSVIQDGALPVLGAFTKLGDFTFTNQYGINVTMRVYKSNAPGAFQSGTSLAIS